MSTHTRGHLTGAQLDRAAGVLLGTGCGDALGAGYEFGPPLADDVTVGMVGGGPFGWAPGEWTDDTSMAVAIAEVTATGADLRTQAAQTRSRRGGPGGPGRHPTSGSRPGRCSPLSGRHPTGAVAAAAAAVHEQRGIRGATAR